MLNFVSRPQLRSFVAEQFPGKQMKLSILSGGLLNQNLRVTVAGQRQPLVLKAYRVSITKDRLDDMHRVMAHAVKADIPVPLPLRTGERDGHQLALYPFVVGACPDRAGTSATVGQLGDMHGRMDAALQTFRSFPEKPTALTLARWDPVAFEEELRAIRKQLQKHPEHVRSLVGKSLDNFEQILDIGGWEKEPFANLPVRVSHNDYHMKNVLIHRGHISAVLDWEKAGWELRGFEVFRSVMFNCRAKDHCINWELAKVYLRAYRTHASLTRAERDTAFECGFRRALFSLWAEKEYLAGQKSLRQNIQRRMVLFKDLKAHRAEYAQRTAELLA